MKCKYCKDTGIWVSPIMGNSFKCEECPPKNKTPKTISNIQYDEGSGIQGIDGHTFWTINGEYHREEGPAEIRSDGSELWYQDGEHHRKGGPAMDFTNGTKKWWINGKLHREDGPAVIWHDGGKHWYLNGKYFSEAKWKEKLNELGLAS